MLRDDLRARLRHLWKDEHGVIGTGAAIAIAALSSAGSSAYNTKKAASQNKQALQAGERSDVRARELEDARLAEERRALNEQLAEKKRSEDERLKYEREEAARKERLYNEAVTRDRERWQDYLRINEPNWRFGSNVLGSLYDIAGFKGGAPAFQMSTQPRQGQALPMTESDYGLGNRAPMAGGPGGIDPEGRWRNMRPAPTRTGYPMMPMSSGGGQSLQSLMQLAQLAGASRMPKPAYTGDVLPPVAYA